MPRRKAEAPKTSLIHTGSAEVVPAGANILIAPQEGPQWDLMLLPWREILFGGAKGGGKTAGARIWALKGNPDEPQDVLVNVSYVYHPGYRCLILRKNAQDMMDFIDKAKSMYEAAYGAIWSGDGYFEFPSGAKIVIGHMASEDAYMKYMGQEWTRIIVEEVTQIKSVMLYMRIISCARTVHSSMKVQILLTANPEGPGFHWVRTRFMTHPKTGKRVPPKTVIEEEVFNPFTNKKEVLTRYFLPSKISDNKILLANDPGYVTLLLGMPESLRKAYIEGDWDVLSGKYFHNFRKDGPLEGEPEWANHCVDSATIWKMPWYKKWCGLDVGFEHWMVCHWFFESEDDDRIYTYRTLRTRRMGMEAFGREWAKRTMEDFDETGGSKAITIWMSHDAFHKRDSSPEAKDISMVSRFEAGIKSVLGSNSVYVPTQEEMPMEPDFFERLELQRNIKVIVRKAPMHRQGSSEYVRELLEWKRPQLNADSYDPEYAASLLSQENGGEKYIIYLKAHIEASRDPRLPKVRIFSDKCPELIRGIEDAIYDEDKLNIAKADCNTETGDGGDDDLQAFIYGLSGYQRGMRKVSNEPMEVKMHRQVHEIARKYNYQLDGSQMAQIKWKALQDAKKATKVEGFKIPRRSSHWFNRQRPKPEWAGPLDASKLQ